MSFLPFLSIKAANLKCFGDTPQGFEVIKSMNVIIGRNNTGKTTLLDTIAFAKNPIGDPDVRHLGKEPSSIVTLHVRDGMEHHIGAIPYIKQNQDHARLILQKRSLSWTRRPQGSFELITDHLKFQIGDPVCNQIVSLIRKALESALDSTQIVSVAADRDILPERDEQPWCACEAKDLSPSGSGATRIMQRMLNNDKHEDRAFVRDVILDELNHIYGPDGGFVRLYTVRREKDQKEIWEVFLEAANGAQVPVSKMGSGVKSILLALLALHVVPRIAPIPELGNYVFLFEELENNLHPAIQKRLFRYLRQFAEDKKCTMCITTHSHVVIDLFSRDPAAQILHVTHDPDNKGLSLVQPISTRAHHSQVFDDLEVRASDLLQSNCVVWVEGPSDRIYFNKWIEAFDPDLREHNHFEFAFTGGTLLSHYTYDDPNDEERIEARRINRNAIILMDKDLESGLKERVRRVSDEIKRNDGLAWITEGKEVENYIRIEALRVFSEEPDLRAPKKNTSIFKLIKDHGKGNFATRKVDLAERICRLPESSTLDGCLDLKDRLKEVSDRIRKWNSMNART
jgi:predicted ATP-dependent endonuclease of OLD family